ncbi:MAG TPA: methyltransferase domain-containing protein [Chlamydiales bacterium]|nr:methyltransferase domain-containing protein [Chlamydiales bacterium]
MKRTVKIILFNLITSASLLFSADVPNWSFNDIHNGWNCEPLTHLYFHYSETQRQWAWELLGKSPFKGDENILDFGCGDGKITAEMSHLVPNGSIIGIDLSTEMLHLAQIKFPHYAYPNLEFKKSDSLTFSDFPEAPLYDVICSFSVFHLVANPLDTLKNLKSRLKLTGKLQLVIPTGTNSVLYRAANEIFSKYNIEAPWSKTVGNENPTMRTLDGCSYFLKEAGYDILSLEIINTENAFYDLDEFIVWMVGTVTANWNIPFSLSRTFFTDLVQRMYELEPQMIDEEGGVRFQMPRIHAIASPHSG